MPLNPWELSYNTLTFGGSLAIGIISVEGVEPPDTKVSVRSNVGKSGSFGFTSYQAERHVIINGDMFTNPSSLEGLINTWRVAFNNQTIDKDLDYRLGTAAARRIKCRPISRDLTISPDYDLGVAFWTVELVAGDPSIYNTSDVKIFNG